LLQVVIVGDVDVVHLPGALVVGQVLPLDQIVHLALLVKAVTQGRDGGGGAGHSSSSHGMGLRQGSS
jgi:hypothetical protein